LQILVFRFLITAKQQRQQNTVAMNCVIYNTITSSMTIITSVQSGTCSLEKALKHLKVCRSLPQGCVLNHEGLIMQHFLIPSAYKADLI